jgi:hypothetical protein
MDLNILLVVLVLGLDFSGNFENEDEEEGLTLLCLKTPCFCGGFPARSGRRSPLGRRTLN